MGKRPTNRQQWARAKTWVNEKAKNKIELPNEWKIVFNSTNYSKHYELRMLWAIDFMYEQKINKQRIQRKKKREMGLFCCYFLAFHCSLDNWGVTTKKWNNSFLIFGFFVSFLCKKSFSMFYLSLMFSYWCSFQNTFFFLYFIVENIYHTTLQNK